MIQARRFLTLGLSIYALGALIASLHPGARLWGIHLIGFLPGFLGAAVVAGMLFGLLLVGLGTFAAGPANAKARSPHRDTSDSKLRLVSLVFLWGAILWLLRSRTNFLGDGTLWLSGLNAGEQLETHAPLAEALWLAVADGLRSIHSGIRAETVAPLSVACGLAAIVLIWSIARHIATNGRGHAFAVVLLTTLGVSQLFFGYIESYPPVAVAILWFVHASLRCVDGRSGVLHPAVALSVAIAMHLGCAFLFPSYIYLILTRAGSPSRRVLLALAPMILASVLLILLGFAPQRWMDTARAAIRGLRTADITSASIEARPYTALSIDHALDTMNEILLVVPVPFLVLLAHALTRGKALVGFRDSRVKFLTVAAASGLAVCAALVLPVAAAQDWDLYSLFLIPVGVLGTLLALPLTEGAGGERVAAGLGLFAGSTLAALVLTNTIPGAGAHRFEVLIGPDAKITKFARTYGYGLLAEYYRRGVDPRKALMYADALLENEPSNHRLWAMAGAIRMDLHDYPGATRCLVEAVARGRNASGTWANLGICYTFQHRYRDALESFQKAALMEPANPDFQLDWALALLNAGEPDSARGALSNILQRWPRSERARIIFQRHFH